MAVYFLDSSAVVKRYLSVSAMAAMQDPANQRLLSAATIWELAIKVGQGKIILAMPYRQ